MNIVSGKLREHVIFYAKHKAHLVHAKDMLGYGGTAAVDFVITFMTGGVKMATIIMTKYVGTVISFVQ